MNSSPDFQTIILKLQQFWAEQGCLIWQPYYTQVGAGTMNPATYLRVLGPEPWKVAYVEPSVRPDDGRYGDNPNRLQMHYQFQIVLKPDPGNPQEIYLDSLKAIGIDPRQHDIRFVEDNWEQPAISAWGLGWEVWLDGQEITQFTYFQQVGGQTLDPVSVEITYGLDRILIALRNAASVWETAWGSDISYGEMRRHEEYEHSKYYFEVADVERLRQLYEIYKAEAEACLSQGLVVPAHDYVLKCSHTFNVLDTRGAIGVTERQSFFGQMRDLARRVAIAYLEQRRELEYPLLTEKNGKAQTKSKPTSYPPIRQPSLFLLELGTEELPSKDVDSAVAQLRDMAPALFDHLRLTHGDIHVDGTPRRLVVHVAELSGRQQDHEELVKGPPADRAFDKNGKPTQAAIGFAKGKGIDVSTLEAREMDGGKYVVALVKTVGRSTPEVLGEALPAFIAGIRFEKSMRWNATNVSFSRPIRWLIALLGEVAISFEYAGLVSDTVTRGLRPNDSPEVKVKSADKYLEVIKSSGILLNQQQRKKLIVEQVKKAAASIGSEAVLDESLLAEITNLVEKPTAFAGGFDPEFLALPREVLISTMQKYQRYFPVEKNGKLVANFVAVRNGDEQDLDLVRQGNEHVLGARFADANFFVREDLKHPLEYYRDGLKSLIFHKQLGSMLNKSERIEKLVEGLVPMLALNAVEAKNAKRAAHLAKADLTTRMVTEMTSLQGIIGREYAVRAGEDQAVADAIGEQYQPIPNTKTGLSLNLADRLDSLVGLFAAGSIPSGTKDPFGLRRAAIGIVQPLIYHNISFDLIEAIKKTAQVQPIPVEEGTDRQVLDFITGRLGVVLKDNGFRYDVVDAILAEQGANPSACAKAVKQLQGWVERKDWSVILPAFARCVRITRDLKQSFKMDAKKFAEKPEEALCGDLEKAEKTPRAAGDVDNFLNAFLPMIPAVNAFFDKVLVMADDLTLRENRLALLQRIVFLSKGVADLSKLEGF
jgi:glycyl-tRNA synthetase